MPSNSNGTGGNNARRSQPNHNQPAQPTQPVTVTAPPRAGKGKTNHKHPRASPGSLAPSSNESGSSGAALSDISRASRKITKAVRGGGGGKGGGKSKTKTNKDKVGGGPEGDLSEDDSYSDFYEEGPELAEVEAEAEAQAQANELIKELGAANVPHERIVEGAEGKSVPRGEIGMDSLIAGAKVRPEHPNISRGYEMLTNPASRMVITFDREEINVKNKNKGAAAAAAPPPHGRKDSLAASIAFSDESEWENIQFEMDEFEGKTEPVIVPVHVPVPTITIAGAGASAGSVKSAYADIVKRPAAPTSA